MFSEYFFPVECNCKNWREISIRFYLNEVPANNRMPFPYHGLCDEFIYRIRPWLFCAIVNGFNLGKIEFPEIKTIEDFHIISNNIAKADNDNRIVTLEFDMSNSSKKILESLFIMLNYRYYIFNDFRTTFKNMFGLPAEKVIKIVKVVISDTEVK